MYVWQQESNSYVWRFFCTIHTLIRLLGKWSRRSGLSCSGWSHSQASSRWIHSSIYIIHWLTQLSATTRSSPWVHVSVSNLGSQCGRDGVLVRGKLLGTVTFASSHSYLVSVFFVCIYVCMYVFLFHPAIRISRCLCLPRARQPRG